MTHPKRKDIPLALQTLEPIEHTVDQLKVMLEVSRLQCEDLLHALRQVRGNEQVTALMPLLTRTIRERNELECQLFDCINHSKRVYVDPYESVVNS